MTEDESGFILLFIISSFIIMVGFLVILPILRYVFH
jgi:uncharacterized membrane protein